MGDNKSALEVLDSMVDIWVSESLIHMTHENEDHPLPPLSPYLLRVPCDRIMISIDSSQSPMREKLEKWDRDTQNF